MRYCVVVAALAAFAVRLAFLGSPVMADEAGLLMVAAQWEPGSSLYGDYWVDRPPGLVAVFAVAEALGGPVALRVIGALAAGAAVVAAGRLGARIAPDRPQTPCVCAVVVATLVSNPLLDVDEVSAEILALPLLLAGLALVVAAATSPAPTRPAFAAGAAGTAAVLLKQSLVEVGLAMAVLVVVGLARGELRPTGRRVAGFVAGSLLVAGPVLALAWARGTSLVGLWDAVVVFRADAGRVIAEDASEETSARARRLALALAATGMPVLLLLLARLRWRTPRGTADAEGSPNDPVLAWGCLVLLGWEAFAVTSGGSYWLHYLLLPVPGMALLVAVGSRQGRPDAGFHRWVLAPVLVSTVVALAVVAADPLERPADDQRVIDYLSAHRDEGSTAVVAFGNPALLRSAGMRSPYPYLWSLPVRVRDADLGELVRVLRGPDRPHWVVRLGDSLTTWGVDAERADRVLDRHYRPVHETERYTIFAQRPWAGRGPRRTAQREARRRSWGPRL